MKKIIVSTGDINKKYEVIGPVYVQVSNKGIFTSTFDELAAKYRQEIEAYKRVGFIPTDRTDWGFLYGEWSVGQNSFDQAFYVCVREIQKKAARLGGDAVIWLRQDIDIDTNAFAYFYLQMYGTVVKYIDDEIDYHRLAALIDAQYLDRIVKNNTDAAKEIQDRKQKIAIHKEILDRKEKAWRDKKNKINEKIRPIEERIIEIETKIAKTKKTIEKFTSDDNNNLNDAIVKKNKELLEKMIELWGNLEAEKESIQEELLPFEEEIAHEYDEHQKLIKELREYESSL